MQLDYPWRIAALIEKGAKTMKVKVICDTRSGSLIRQPLPDFGEWTEDKETVVRAGSYYQADWIGEVNQEDIDKLPDYCSVIED